MTTAELIDRYRALVGYDLDSTLGPVPDSDDGASAAYDRGIVGYLNEAMLVLAKAAYVTDPAVALTLSAGVGRYPLDGPAFARRVLAPYSVTAGGRRLLDAAGSGYGLWSAAELVRCHPNWAADAPGTPTKAVVVGGDLLLHPAPAAGGTAYVEAQIAPARLSAATPDGVPGLPEELHPAIAQMAVVRSCLPYSQTGSQGQRLSALLSEANATAEEVGRERAALALGNGSTVGLIRVGTIAV